MEFNTFLSGVEGKWAGWQVEAGSLYAQLSQLTDHRGRQGRRYPLAVVVTLVVLGKLAGESTLSGIAQWARWRKTWLCEVFGLARRQLPCANTYLNVCRQVDVAELNALLEVYFRPDTSAAAGAALRHVALDGKTLRGSDQQGVAAKEAVQVVTLYEVSHKRPLAQQARLPGQDERALAAQLLAEQDVQGCVVSADALHTQRSWAEQVAQQGGDYLLIAKGNQAQLRNEIAELFADVLPRWMDEREAHSTNKGHGRLEVRHLRVSCDLAELLAPTWYGVAQVFQLERRITRHGTTRSETVYGLTSLRPEVADPALLLSLIRNHWFIENNVHWRRDVTLGEDRCLVRSAPAALTLALLNTAVLAFCDRLQPPTLPALMRFFAAFPAVALHLLLAKPDF